MRIKFEKGFTPQAMAAALEDFIVKNDLLIGSVNVFIQLCGEDGKPINDFKSPVMAVVSPTQRCKDEYSEYSARLRRRAMKAVQKEAVGG